MNILNNVQELKNKKINFFEFYGISPTGLGLRSDSEGDGKYRAKRSNAEGWHDGFDFLCHTGQKIVAPFENLLIERIWYPYRDLSYGGLMMSNSMLQVILCYFQPITELVGTTVKIGQTIGYAQSISKRYGANMQDHIHCRIPSFNPELLIKIL
jgi:hypothetical protein